MMSTNPSDATGAERRERLDLLISRIAGGDASPGDWEAFAALAADDPAVWRSLASAQRDHQSLSLAVGVALHAADRVELPSRHAGAAWAERFPDRDHAHPARRIAAAGGWAVAAALALAMFAPGLGGLRPVAPVPAGTNAAGLIPAGYVAVRSPEDALKAYMDVGLRQNRVLGELGEPVMVKRRQTDDGRIEVLYVRQFVERAELSDLVRFAQDEAGRSHPVRVSVPKAPSRAD